jgi:hypothetical protein
VKSGDKAGDKEEVVIVGMGGGGGGESGIGFKNEIISGADTATDGKVENIDGHHGKSSKDDAIIISSPDVSTIFWQQMGFSRCEPVWDLTQFIHETYKPSSSLTSLQGAHNNLPKNSGPFSSTSFSLRHSQTNHISAQSRFGAPKGKEEDVHTYAAKKRDVFIGRISTDVNPFTGRWRGGVSVLQNAKYFFETYDNNAFKILRRRLCNDLENKESASIYPFMQVAMEMTRYIALAFEIITTSNLLIKHEEFLGTQAEGRKVTKYLNAYPKFQLTDPDDKSQNEDSRGGKSVADKTAGFLSVHTVVEDQQITGTCKSDSYTIQQRDVVPEEKYMYSWQSYWHLITERDAVERLFCIGMIIFENIFYKNDCKRSDCDEIFAATSKYLREFMVHAKSIKQIEDVVSSYFDSIELNDSI